MLHMGLPDSTQLWFSHQHTATEPIKNLVTQVTGIRSGLGAGIPLQTCAVAVDGLNRNPTKAPLLSRWQHFGLVLALSFQKFHPLILMDGGTEVIRLMFVL